MTYNIREAATRANAMSAGGMDSKKIVDRLLQSNTMPEVNKRIEQFRQQGISDDKIVSELSKKSEQIQPTVTHEDPKGLLGFMGKVTGAEKLGTRLGSELGMATLDSDTKRRLAEAEQKGFVEKGTQRELSTGGVTDKQAWASAGATAMNLATPFAGKALSPAGAGLQKLTAIGAGTGALEGGLMSVAEGDSFGEGALIGGAIGGAIPLAGAALEYFSSRMPKAFGFLSGESEDTFRKALSNPDAFDDGLVKGNVNERLLLNKMNKGIKESSEEFLTGNGKRIDAVLNQSRLSNMDIKKKSILDSLKGFLKDSNVEIKGNSLDFTNSAIKHNGAEIGKIEDIIKSINSKKSYSLKQVNELKRLVGSAQRWTDGLVTSSSPSLSRLYGELNDIVGSNLPDNLKSIYAESNGLIQKYSPMLTDFTNATGPKGGYNKLTSAIKKHSDKLFEFLETTDMKNLESLKAGQTVAENISKRGGTASLLNPATWTNMAFSPTAKGKLMSGAGRKLQTVQNALNTQLPNIPGNLPGLSGSLGNVRTGIQQGGRQLTAGGINLAQ